VVSDPLVRLVLEIGDALFEDRMRSGKAQAWIVEENRHSTIVG
jgi:hypothetical protein